MTRRLRVAHVLIQPVLVWDDGDELEPGPAIQAQQLPLAKVASWLVALPGELDRIALESAVQGDASSQSVAVDADS
jgi:hypothetical protein